MEPVRYRNIDALRAVAALAVFGFHLCVQHGVGLDGSVADFYRIPFVTGWMGVELFIVISGCVISLLIFSSHGRGWSASRFLVARLARIGPLHWLTLVLFAMWQGEPWSAQRWASFASNFSFVHILRIEWFRQFNWVSWSVALEMQFYLLMALVALRLATANKYWVLGSCLLVSAATKILVIAGFGYALDMSDARLAEVLHVRLSQLPSMLDLFGLGYFVAALLRESQAQRVSDPPVHARQATAAWLLVFAIAGLCAFYFRYWSLAMRPATGSEQLWPYVFEGTVRGALFAALLWSVCTLRTVSAPALAWLGERSYGIYLWHPLVLGILGSVGPRNPVVASLLAVAATLVLASTSWRFVERPAMKWAKGKFTAARTAHAMAIARPAART